MNLCKRPGITAKVFLAVLLTAALVSFFMGGATHRSFEQGFLGLLNTQQIQRMEAAIPSLQHAYAQHQGWGFLRDRPDIWFRLIGSERAVLEPEPTIDDALASSMGPDLLGAGRRLTLLDDQRQRVIGFPFIMASTVQRDIVVDGQTVGWLAIAPIETATDAAVEQFLDAQLRSLWVVAGIALVFSALIAWWVARALLAPVRRVAAATHQLAAGHYGLQVPVRGNDEVAQLAQDFNQLSHALARHEAMRRDLVADISHELRTPLAVLRAELEAVEDGIHPLTPSLLRVLQSQVEAMTQLVGDLHELALADAGALTYQMQETALVPLVQQVVRSFEGRCHERGLRLEGRWPQAPVLLQADAPRLGQLLRNLLENSVRYTDAPGQIVVSLEVLSMQVVLRIEDSAPGVPDEALPRLLDRFYRVEGSRGRRGGGSGLGLAIGAAIVQAHGGTVQASHAALGGVCIMVCLPLQRGAA